MTLDVPPTIKENRTFVPLRFIAEAFGSEVQWDPNEKKIIILYYPYHVNLVSDTILTC